MHFGCRRRTRLRPGVCNHGAPSVLGIHTAVDPRMAAEVVSVGETNGPARRQRPLGAVRVIVRSIVTTVASAIGLVLADALLDGFDLRGRGAALLVALVIGVVNAAVWPLLRWLVAPIGVLTLGLGALLANAVLVGLVVDVLPGTEREGLGTAVVITAFVSAFSFAASALMAVDDDEWFDRRMAARARRRSRLAGADLSPGIVFVQLDGLARPVLERAMRSGDAPTLASWRARGSHELMDWTPEWSCQTGVSQCGILHGDVTDMPAFRWIDKSTGRIVVSNHPKDAAEIERTHSSTPGLLAGGGSSYGNLFTGGAERAVLTMSVAGRTKEGRIGSGYGRYFSQPYQTFRTLGRVVAEVTRERRAARDQRQRNVQPRVDRDMQYAFLRAFTTIISRDVCLAGVLDDMAEGRPAIYVDFLGFDEVAHHSGPERHDTLRVIRGLDRDLGRIDRARHWCTRPYEIVVLSDHGQTQGATFRDRYGETLAEVVARVTGAASTGRSREDETRTESTALLRAARGSVPDEVAEQAPAVVLGSGNLALIGLMDATHRLSLEQIDERYPALVPTLVGHPGVGFVLAVSDLEGAVVLGPSGRRLLDARVVEGDDPLAPFGPAAVDQVSRVARYSNLPDLMVNSLYDPVTEEVAAFEEQVSSHGGLGGDQQRPFLLRPTVLPAPTEPIIGPVALHHLFRSWREHLAAERVAVESRHG